jgi:putative oxidoreductase
MSYGILFLRVVLGATLAGHGAQKLFGWFGGAGPEGTAGFFGSLGFRPPLLMAYAAGLAELGGGLLVAVGLVMPIGALAVATVMVTAVATVHWKNGFWSTAGGYEYNLLIWTSAIALATTGGLRFSLDDAAGWADSFSGVWWGVGVLAGSLAAGATTLALGRDRHHQLSPQT